MKKPTIKQRISRWLIRNALDVSTLPVPDPEGPPGSYIFGSGVGGNVKTIVPAAYAAVNILTNTLASLPKCVETIFPDETREPDPTHPISTLLQYPSRVIDCAQFWELLFRDLHQHGNCYAYIRRMRNGWPVELVPATVEHTRWDRDKGQIIYSLQLWGRSSAWYASGNRELIHSIPAQDVLAIHNAGFDGLQSPSPILFAGKQALLMSNLINTSHRNALGFGLNARTMIKTAPDLADLSADKRAELREELQDTVSGASKAGKTTVLPPGFEPVITGEFSAVDLQLIELLKWNLGDIARIWAVPPRMLQHYSEGMRLTGASFEQQAEDFERWSVRPHVNRVATQLTTKLLLPHQIDEPLSDVKQVVGMDTDEIRGGSLADRVKTSREAVQGGLYTPNEGRRYLKKRRIDDPEADKLQAKKVEQQGFGKQGAPGESRKQGQGEGDDEDGDDT